METNKQDIIPAIHIFRRGDWYKSLDSEKIYDTMPLTICYAPKVMLIDDVRWIRQNIKNMVNFPDFDERKNIVYKALDLFMNGSVIVKDLGLQSFDDFCSLMRQYMGLTKTLVKNWAKLLNNVMHSAVKNDLKENDSKNFTFISLPSNTFMCLESCLDAVIKGSVLFIRPSMREPFAAARMTACLIAAGYPKELIGFYPCKSEILQGIIGQMDQVILYGGEDVEKQYGKNEKVDVRGPGRAVVIIGNNGSEDEIVNWLVSHIAENAGRFCINIGTILTLADAEKIGSLVAQRLDKISIDETDVEEAEEYPLTHWLDADYVSRTDEWIKNNMMKGDKIITSRPICAENKNGRLMLIPSLISIDNPLESPLIGVELPFPFAVIGKIKSLEEAESLIKNSRFVYKIGFESGNITDFIE